MDDDFSEKNELNDLLENIFKVCDDEMRWSCNTPPENSDEIDQEFENPDLNYTQQLIFDMKGMLDTIQNNLKVSSEKSLDINNNIMTLISIKGSIESLNNDIIDFQSSVGQYIDNAPTQSPVNGNIQAINDIISIL